ncbi:MAG: MarR family transcriptional regulator [Myxococcaceae bacterium]|nr:MarR family transcriptional regulator [Myxococcaceae bacterium]
MTRARAEIDRVWQSIVAMVIDTRGDWRRRVSEATGLSFTPVRALMRLAAAPLTLSELAESLGTDAPAATVAVNVLVTRGLATRREHPSDRRAKLVSLTTAGRAVLRVVQSVPDPAPEALAALSAQDSLALTRIFGDARERSSKK